MTDDERERIARGAVLFALNGQLPQRADFDDMTQDALVAVWQAEQTWDGRTPLVTRCRMMAKWAVVDGLRRRQGRPGRDTTLALHRMVALDDDTEGSEGEEVARGLAADDDTEAVVMARAEVADLAERIATLTPIQADALRACSEGVSQTTLARQRGVSVSAVCRSRRIALAKIA